MLHNIRQAAAALALCAASPSLAQPTPDAAFAGHYYLSGVMETGSELLLNPDGRFEWFLAYGALDQFAKGRWERRGDTIALVADMPDTSRPLFALEPQQAWNAQAESALREAEEDDKRRAIEVKCPFLYDVSVETSFAAAGYEDRPSPKSRARAKAALLAAIERRGEAEQAMAAAIAGPTDASNAAAAEAMRKWLAARTQAYQVHYSSGLEMPSLDDPKPPPACEVPPYEPVDVSSPSVWRRGAAVLVGNAETESRFASINVTFHFADGREARAVTDPGGWAVAPKSAAPMVAVTLSFDKSDEPLSSGRLAMTPLAEGIQPVRLDIDQLTRAPFTTLVLRIDGKDLLPESGRYSRE